MPLIIAGPGIPAGVRVTDIARTRQIFATALELAGMKGEVLRRTSLTRLWDAGLRAEHCRMNPPSRNSWITPPCRRHARHDQHHHAGVAAHLPAGSIAATGFIIGPQTPWNSRTSPICRTIKLVVEHLKASLLSIVEGSYRPWRDTGYLTALSGPNFSPDLEATKSIPQLPGGPLLPQGAGAAQTLFRPNPETPQSSDRIPDAELLNSLPYDAH